MATATVSTATIAENNGLSFGNRQRASTTATLWVTQQRRQQQQQQHQMLMRKQNSFIESGNSRHTRGYHLQRGVSLNRCGSRPLAIGVRTQNIQQQQRLNKRYAASIDQELHLRSRCDSVGKCKDFNGKTAQQGCGNGSVGLSKQRSIVAWSSASSLLLKSLDDELAQLNASLQQKLPQPAKLNSKPSIVTSTLANKEAIKKPKPIQHSNSIAAISTQISAHQKVPETNAKTDVKKTNLNIVLEQTIKATTEQEFNHSDIESSTEAHSPLLKRGQAITSNINNNNSNNNNNNHNTATYRRAQFQLSRNTTTNNISSNSATTTATAGVLLTTTTTTTTTTTATTAQLNTTNNSNNNNNLPLQNSPILTVRRRPPLVRAMSAPVRTLDAKNVTAVNINNNNNNNNNNNSNNNNNNKRKPPRRRKLNARNSSCDKSDANEFQSTTDNSLNEVGILGAGKPISQPPALSRSKSVAAADVITLVSLISSEGSDSEKEDTSTTTTTTSNSDNTPTRGGRAPTLRKAGKSVSFQEHYPSTLQLATKEYSHMLRRGSIAPFTARLRANRPPTAPPVSIFMLDSCGHNNNNNNNGINNISARADKMSPISKPAETQKSECATVTSHENNDMTTEYVYPDYVHSIKERECWKLYQKMSAKGVNVTYDTILRGMLTPTEFRQLQKQREHDENKKRALAALEEAAPSDTNAKPTTAVERLSEALLKK